MPTGDLSSYIAHLSYFGIFLWFLIIEQLTPIPEEVSLMSVGYIAVHTGLDPFFCGVVSLTGLLATDSFLFYISAKGNKFSQKLLSKVNTTLLDKIKTRLKNKAGLTIFTGALLPKLRFFNPMIVAVVNIPFKTFFIYNGLATLLYVTVYMLVGIFFHSQLDSVLKELALLKHSIFIVLMIAVTIFIIWKAQKIVFSKIKNEN